MAVKRGGGQGNIHRGESVPFTLPVPFQESGFLSGMSLFVVTQAGVKPR